MFVDLFLTLKALLIPCVLYHQTNIILSHVFTSSPCTFYTFSLQPFMCFFSVIMSCVKVDERALRDIMEMGFNREAARQALMDNNNNLEVALNSLLTGSSGSRHGPAVAESNKPQTRGTDACTTR